MSLTRKDALKLLGSGAVTAAARTGDAGTPEVDRSGGGRKVITRDVAIIGGGSTGTYAAIQLRDLGKSVVVVEAADRLGGHTQTYTDPGTGATIDIGVVVWHDLEIVRDYFARFDVPLMKAPLVAAGTVVKYVDYRTGAEVAGHAPGDPSPGLAAYGAQLAQYPYLEQGFDLPSPIPPELLLPFGAFVRKYGVDPAVGLISHFAQGLGNLLEQPTLYVMKNFGLDILRNLVVGFLTTARHHNSELYEKARAELGADALLCSRVVSTDRDGSGHVKVLVRTPGGLTTIRARKLLVTIPPLLRNLTGFDLDGAERSLFAQFRNTGYYTGLLRGTGIPDNYSVNNTGADTDQNLPVLPGVYLIYPTGVPGFHHVKYGSPVQVSDRRVKADILAAVRRLRIEGVAPATSPELAAFASHSPFELTVSTDAIHAGFYRDLHALQGRNRTFYTGAAFHTHDSALLWQFTEALLPRLVC